MSRKKTQTHTDVDPGLLDELNGFVEKVTAMVGSAPALSATDKRRSLKLRKGGETVIPTVAALSKQFGLTVDAHPTDAMVAKMKKVQDLIPLHRKLVAATKQVGDSMFLAQSESWESATVYYTMLRRLGSSDGDVKQTLAPVKQFFAQRSRKPKASSSASAAPTVVEAPGATTESPAPATSPAATPQTATPSPAPSSTTHS